MRLWLGFQGVQKIARAAAHYSGCGFTATYPQNGPNDSVTDFTVKGDLVVASMLIPGADKNVKDAISVSSKMLQEMQQIDLIFGTPPK